MHAGGGKDPEPRPPLLQARTGQSGKPGSVTEHVLRDEAGVSSGSWENKAKKSENEYIFFYVNVCNFFF